MRSQEGMFSYLHYALSWSNVFSNGRGKKCSLIANGRGAWHGNAMLIYFFAKCFPNYEEQNEEEEEAGVKVKLEGKCQNNHF